MLWTANRITALKHDAAEARARIRDLVIKGLVTDSPTGGAWGQFLDEVPSSTQYGIYGTSACIQILVASQYPANNEVVAAACRILESVLQEENNPSRQDGDICVTYKLAYLAEAVEPDHSEIESVTAPMAELLKRTLPGGGWGEFFCSSSQLDPHPRVVPTAAALSALRRHVAFRRSKECEESLRWLGQRLLEDGQLRPHEFVLASLTVIEYGLHGSPTASQQQTVIEACKQRVLRWAGSRQPAEIGESEAYCYSAQWEGRRVNRYLFFMPDCLAALALLKSGCPKRTKSYVLRVCDYFSKQILLKGGFRPTTTGRISSVDHLWIHRLLQELGARDVRSLSVMPGWLSFLFAFTSAFLLLTLGCIGLYFASTAQIKFKVAGGALATISFGFLVRFLWTMHTRQAGRSE